ncbi:MAG: hypothetical protein OXI15_25825 [Chromatiales bacterium]|nr:hypothetical protein [Chromatiales bacterium]
MRRYGRTLQGRLFEPESPTIATTGEQRDRLVELVGALVLEVMTNRNAQQAGGDHDAGDA